MLAPNTTAVSASHNAPSALLTVLGAPRIRAQTTVQALLMPRPGDAQAISLLDEPAVQQLIEFASSDGWSIQEQSRSDFEQVDSSTEQQLDSEGPSVALVLLDSSTAHDSAQLRQLRRYFPFALFVLGPNDIAPAKDVMEYVDLVLPASTEIEVTRSLLQHAHAYRLRSLKARELLTEVGVGRQRMHQLSEIGASLSSRRDLDDLLQTILSEARRLVGCDAASLYLVESDIGRGVSSNIEDDNQSATKQLLFKLSQCDSLNVPFVEMRLPYSTESLAGYVAVTGHELNLDDVYELPEGTPYQFNASFDESMGYRTRSMLVLPMRDHRGAVLGVLQFINRLDENGEASLKFNEESTELLRAIAGQAAVSIQKNHLLQDFNDLFESFVQASIKTIERRDPTTSGHSFRVAQTTVALMRALPRSNIARFDDLEVSQAHLKEVRYAALLHDFGKIGVSERVLIKPRKVSDERLALLQYRIELQKERLRRRSVERQLDLYHGHSGGHSDGHGVGHGVAAHGSVDVAVEVRALHVELDKQLSMLDQYYDWLVQANEPDMIGNGNFEFLQEVRDYQFLETDGTLAGLISESDMLALSVKRGSLTDDERREIQSHVVHTQEFLSTLHWPPELAGVPKIAGAHHEKLNGSGYPHGLAGDQIPLATRVMTVCDIYDALTAMDRPYKPAMSVDSAIAVLHKEVELQLLDADVVRVFVDSNISEIGPASSN